MHQHHLPTLESCEAAWREAVRIVVETGVPAPPVTDPSSISSGFGKGRSGSLESLVVALRITDPRRRWIGSRARNVNRSYCAAQFIWAMRASSASAEISPYNPRGADFASADGLLHAAIGSRVRGENGAADQLRSAIERLRRDPGTKRAFIAICRPSDILTDTRDFSCTSSLHLLLRDGRLHAIGHMRAQSALMVLPYDLFQLTMLHEYCAAELGCELGEYTHVANSLHIFDDELTRARDVLLEPDTRPGPMSRMPPSPSAAMPLLIASEAEARAAAAAHAAAPQVPPALPTYWAELLEEAAKGLPRV
jgi:thymidylate synthase